MDDEIENVKIRIPNETYCPNHSPISDNPYFDNNTDIFTNNDIINILYTSDDEGVSISPIKSILTSASSMPTKIVDPLCKLEKFLPPKKTKFHKTLVIDLDETLIHSYFDTPSPRKADISYDIIIENKKMHVNSLVRPGAIEFLEKVTLFYEVVIFTASLSQYANPLLDYIDKSKKCSFRLYREHCCSYNNGFTNCFTKDLKKLDRDMKNLIIIDNNPRSYILNKENGLPIKTWVDDINDNELIKLIPYLEFLGNELITDVRPILSQINTGVSLDFEKFNEIIENYKNDNFENVMDNSDLTNELHDITIDNDYIFEEEEQKSDIKEEINENKENNENTENNENNIIDKSEIERFSMSNNLNYNNSTNNEKIRNEIKNAIINDIVHVRQNKKLDLETNTLESKINNKSENCINVNDPKKNSLKVQSNLNVVKQPKKKYNINKNKSNRCIPNKQELNSSIKSHHINTAFSNKIINFGNIQSKDLFTSDRILNDANNTSYNHIFKEKGKLCLYLGKSKDKVMSNQSDFIIPRVKYPSKNQIKARKNFTSNKKYKQTNSTNNIGLIVSKKSQNKLYLNTRPNITKKTKNNSNNTFNARKIEPTKKSALNFHVLKNNMFNLSKKIVTTHNRNNRLISKISHFNIVNTEKARRPSSCTNNISKRKYDNLSSKGTSNLNIYLKTKKQYINNNDINNNSVKNFEDSDNSKSSKENY